MIVLPTAGRNNWDSAAVAAQALDSDLMQNCRDVLAAKRFLAGGQSYSITPRKKYLYAIYGFALDLLLATCRRSASGEVCCAAPYCMIWAVPNQ